MCFFVNGLALYIQESVTNQSGYYSLFRNFVYVVLILFVHNIMFIINVRNIMGLYYTFLISWSCRLKRGSLIIRKLSYKVVILDLHEVEPITLKHFLRRARGHFFILPTV